MALIEMAEDESKKERDDKGRYVKGWHGGPGRGNGVKLGDVLRHHVDADEMARALLKLVRKGDFQAIAYVYNRLDGMPRQTSEVTVSSVEKWEQVQNLRLVK